MITRLQVFKQNGQTVAARLYAREGGSVSSIQLDETDDLDLAIMRLIDTRVQPKEDNVPGFEVLTWDLRNGCP